MKIVRGLPWVIGALAVVCAGAAVAVLLRDDHMEGPNGRLPEPVAQRPPVGRARLVATGPRDTLVYGGLAVTTGARGNRRGVYAIDIASGRAYWHYDRPSFPIAIDHRSAGVIVKADEDDDLTEINAPSGRIRWSTSQSDIGPVNRVLVPETATRNLVLLGGDGIAAVDRTTGTTRWKKRWPAHSGCSASAQPNHQVALVVGGTIAVRCIAADARNDAVRGFDIATGRQWITPITQLVTGPRLNIRLVGEGNQDRLGVTNLTESNLVLLDPATGKVRARRAVRGEFQMVFRDGMQVTHCNVGRTEGICGSDPNTGRRLWGAPLPDGMGFSAALSVSSEIFSVANNHCVYVLADRNPATRSYEADIVVFDSRTGRLRGRWPLPPDFRALGGLKDPITDGIVAVSGEKGDYLYADSPGAAGPRQLVAR